MKKTFFVLLSLFIINTSFAFDWPQAEVTEESCSSYFGQNRGDILSTSMVFGEPAEIKAADNGYILIVMTEQLDDTDFFPSTLGSSIILSHEDNLLSVYGNLESDTITLNDENEKYIDAQATLGQSGNTGWQNEKGNLEFQVIDAKNKSAINPKILMPRLNKEMPLSLSGIYIENKSGTLYDINVSRTYASGIYRIYQRRNLIAAPYRTAIAINGTMVDQISYDTISQENGKLCVTGKKKYTSKDIYPTDNLQLIGEAVLSSGRATLTLYSEDILNTSRHLNYNVTVY
ncbi:MAG: peptidoglycan DD-metalloendopeptidase family protein [Treponema sp.]|nr:peptidoglycan DD-metalloendopeptidase family protein [Treponema sp.]